MKYELPWKAVLVGGSWDVTTHTGDPRDEFSVLEYADEAECRFIARACNAHADMLRACDRARELLQLLASMGLINGDVPVEQVAINYGETMAELDFAIAKAKEDSPK